MPRVDTIFPWFASPTTGVAGHPAEDGIGLDVVMALRTYLGPEFKGRYLEPPQRGGTRGGEATSELNAGNSNF